MGCVLTALSKRLFGRQVTDILDILGGDTLMPCHCACTTCLCFGTRRLSVSRKKGCWLGDARGFLLDHVDVARQGQQPEVVVPSLMLLTRHVMLLYIQGSVHSGAFQ